MNCPFCNYKLTPCEPELECFKCLNLTPIDSMCFTVIEGECLEFCFKYNDFKINYNPTDDKNYMHIEAPDNKNWVYNGCSNNNEYPLTPQNVEKRLPFYLVYS